MNKGNNFIIPNKLIFIFFHITPGFENDDYVFVSNRYKSIGYYMYHGILDVDTYIGFEVGIWPPHVVY